MNHILNFKLILKNNAELNNPDLVGYEYGVHLPNAEMISMLIEKCVLLHFRQIEASK